MKWTIAAAAVALLVWLAVSAPRAQDAEPAYPHGDFQEDCTLCHGSEAWVPARISPDFDHGSYGQPLEGQHRQAACFSCHASLEFRETDTACASCHLDVHQGELGADCADCHTPRGFIDRSVMVRRHTTTLFPLDGAHRIVDCEDCHAAGNQDSLQFVNTPFGCENCHLDLYLATTDPDHQAADFPRDCQNCHTPRQWDTGPFDHASLPPSSECVSCHLGDYQTASDPDHVSSGIPQTCEDCHSTSAWTPANFDHRALAPGTPCVNCHLGDYLGTGDPDHQAAGFPQECEACHSTNAWVPATEVDHDPLYFPIYSGKHKGKWSACSDCHVVPNNFATFSCIDCHEHDDRADVGDDHDEVSGYVYESQECFSCHPSGD